MSSTDSVPPEPFSLIRSAVSMQWALQTQSEISELFKEQAITPFLELLECSIKTFDLASIYFYQETISDLSNDKIIFRFEISQDTYGFMLLDDKAPCNMADLYYGGNGGVDTPGTGITKAEQKLIRDIATVLITTWCQNWHDRILLTSKDPELILHLPRKTDPFLVSRFVYQLGNYKGELLLAMPAFFISAAVRSEMSEPSSSSQELFKNLQRIPVRIRAELARKWVSVSQIKELQTGDILPLNWPDVAFLRAGRSLLYTAKPAAETNRLVLEITGMGNQE